MHDFISVRPCGRDLFELIPKKNLKINLDLAADLMEKQGFEISDKSEMALSVKREHDICLYPNGKMLVFPAKSGEEAEQIGQNIIGILRGSQGCVLENKL